MPWDGNRDQRLRGKEAAVIAWSFESSFQLPLWEFHIGSGATASIGGSSAFGRDKFPG